MTHIESQETGVFQVSFDSLQLDSTGALHECVRKYCDGGLDVRLFIERMKSNHEFALEYCARLLRESTAWDGPIRRHEINQWLSRAAALEFERLLA